jgi:hypothetical protein
MVQNHTFPKWSAPLVGALAGAWCSTRFALVPPAQMHWIALFGAFIGVVAGSAIWLLEPTPAENDAEAGGRDGEQAHHPGTLVGRVLALAVMPLCFAPAFGLVFASFAFWFNRRTTGWVKFVCWVNVIIALLCSLFVGSVFLVAYLRGELPP